MTLQLTLDGGYKLLDARGSDQVLDLVGPEYVAHCEAIAGDNQDTQWVYSRAQFAILSVHSPFDATCKAWLEYRLGEALKGNQLTERQGSRILRSAHADSGSVVLYPHQKARYLSELRATLPEWERGDDWRWALRKNVLGLGIAKASFAAAIADPLGFDGCCIDTHMAKLFEGQVPKGALGKKRYLALEAKVRRLARRHNLPTFATQWALWDAKRGYPEPHTVLSSERGQGTEPTAL
jgi:hypothetical protein